MPKQVINHQNTVIYKIVSKDLNVKDCYVGSTTAFSKRKNLHKHNSLASNGILYETIRNNGNWENWQMIEIEKYPCNDRNEATARERHYVELLNSNLNVNIPNRTAKEWEDANKDYHKNYFLTKLKDKMVHCPCCNKDVKYMSKLNHTRGNLHIKNMKKFLEPETLEPEIIEK
jgi:hypothetical protein